MGPAKTFAFFARKEKIRGTAAFVVGIIVILLKYPLIGFCIELYGIFSLFGDFFGVIAGFLGSIPIIGPYITRMTARSRQLPV